jgi:predicted phosphoadenosine phosphosulfate sulfurtransferase
MKLFSSTNVYEASLKRLVDAYKAGDRMVVAFSAGKDSTVVLEMAIAAARITGNLPVEVWMRDEEIMLPGTYEYAERVASRPEVKMHWLISGQASVNIFNRKNPYYWVFDPLLDPSQWMRTPPPYAKWVDQLSLYNVVNPASFPPPEGHYLVVIMGVRGSESRRRNMLIHQSGGAWSGFTGQGAAGKGRDLEKHFRPIYDWNTSDVWRAIKEFQWDYNDAYNAMTRFGMRASAQRIAPIAMTTHGIPMLALASKAWPNWFEKLNERLPGVRLAALYGKRAIEPVRKQAESWEQAYQRLNIDEAPDWIKPRADISPLPHLQLRQCVVEAHDRGHVPG